jgi:hypothetical protein
VPCADCDFALLDAEWRDYVERVRPRLAREQHVAAVYSGREGGLERFLGALRAHPKDQHELVPGLSRADWALVSRPEVDPVPSVSSSDSLHQSGRDKRDRSVGSDFRFLSEGKLR